MENGLERPEYGNFWGALFEFVGPSFFLSIDLVMKNTGWGKKFTVVSI